MTSQTETPKSPQVVTLPLLIVFGLGLLVIGLLIGWLFNSLNSNGVATVDNVVEQEAVSISAGGAVRAGSGTPSTDYGVEGDIFLNIKNGDVYLFDGSEWTVKGNLAEAAYENLMGPQGDQGKQGEQGESGDRGDTGKPGPVGHEGPAGPAGKNGTDGTRVLLGAAEPSGPCTTDGDIFINVKDSIYYTCSATKWQQFKF